MGSMGIIRAASALVLCFVVVMVVLGLLYFRGFLSPRGLGVGLMISIGVLYVAVFRIIRRSAKDSDAAHPPTGGSIDVGTRKRLLRGILVGKVTISVMVLSLIVGLVRGGPLFPTIVGIIVNLTITSYAIMVVRRLQRSLDGEERAGSGKPRDPTHL